MLLTRTTKRVLIKEGKICGSLIKQIWFLRIRNSVFPNQNAFSYVTVPPKIDEINVIMMQLNMWVEQNKIYDNSIQFYIKALRSIQF